MEAENLDQREATFTRREVREASGLSQTQVRRHLDNLLDLEFLATKGGRNGVLIRYELLADTGDGENSLYHIGLIDTAELRKKQGGKDDEK